MYKKYLIILFMSGSGCEQGKKKKSRVASPLLTHTGPPCLSPPSLMAARCSRTPGEGHGGGDVAWRHAGGGGGGGGGDVAVTTAARCCFTYPRSPLPALDHPCWLLISLASSPSCPPALVPARSRSIVFVHALIGTPTQFIFYISWSVLLLFITYLPFFSTY